MAPCAPPARKGTPCLSTERGHQTLQSESNIPDVIRWRIVLHSAEIPSLYTLAVKCSHMQQKFLGSKT